VIAIVDVCSGNLRSVQRALLAAGGEVVVTRDPDVVRRADKIVVPGQGSFGMFVAGLADGRGLAEVLREAIARGTPYLGICLGLQVLFEGSEESEGAGLGVLRGRVVKFAASPQLKVPHIGWNRVRATCVDSLASGVDGQHVYFVHSYHAAPVDRGIIAMESQHGSAFCAAVRRDNLFACQFHPEKSQAVGIAMLRRFVEAA
jgi:glutamine amidotransferase